MAITKTLEFSLQFSLGRRLNHIWSELCGETLSLDSTDSIQKEALEEYLHAYIFSAEQLCTITIINNKMQELNESYLLVNAFNLMLSIHSSVSVLWLYAYLP